MKKYRLVSAISVPKRFLIQNHLGSRFQLVRPGVTYECSDEAFAVLQKQKERLRPTAQIRAALDEEGIPYEEVACKSCGGRVMKLEFSPVVEVE